MKICIKAHLIIPGWQISWKKKESTHSTCAIINSAEGYTVRGSFNWSFPMKGQLLGERFLWASRTFTQGWRGRQMMGLALKQSGGNLQDILKMLKSTCQRTKRQPIKQIRPTKRKTCHLTPTTRCDVSLERPRLTITDYKDPPLSDFRLIVFSWAVSSCLETDTPAGRLETILLSKTGTRRLGGHKDLGHRIVELHIKVYQI